MLRVHNGRKITRFNFASIRVRHTLDRYLLLHTEGVLEFVKVPKASRPLKLHVAAGFCFTIKMNTVDILAANWPVFAACLVQLPCILLIHAYLHLFSLQS